MVKREGTRVVVIGGIGLVIALILFITGWEKSAYVALFLPMYCIGMFYAAETLFMLQGRVLKTYFSAQFISFLTKPLRGTLLCVLLLIFGFIMTLCLGWLFGLGKCVSAFITAFRLDRECEGADLDYRW